MQCKMLIENKVPLLAEILLTQLFGEERYLKTVDVESNVKIIGGRVCRLYDIFYRGNLYMTIDWFGELDIHKRSFNIFKFYNVMEYINNRADIWEDCDNEVL